jgi:sialic acid synthase SpsE
MIERAEMNLEIHQQLALIARECGVDFLSTPFSNWAVDILEKVDVPAYKVASMDLTNYPLLSYIVQTRKPIYLSTGMATLSEITATVDYLKEKSVNELYLLHCLSLYPPKAEELNLSVIPFLKEVFNVPVGYSNHFPGTKACLAAFMHGADIIETHFTLDTSLPGGDHANSTDPVQLKQLVEDIQLFITMRGSGDISSKRADRININLFRRGVYAVKDIEQGTPLSKELLIFCRPPTELSPNDLKWIEGRMIRRKVQKGQALLLEDIY